MKKPKKPKKRTVELRVAFELPEGWTKKQAMAWARETLRADCHFAPKYSGEDAPAEKSLRVNFI